jgi:DNA-binding NarL/FixJ family response regulator
VTARFLLVEDDYLVRGTYARVIRAHGECEEAASLEDVEDFDLSTYTAFFIDVQLPRKSGIELLKRIRRAGIRTPVVMFSGNLDHETVNHVFSLDAGFLNKPIDLRQLRNVAANAAAARTNGRTRRATERARARWELTTTEAEILELAMSRYTSDEIQERRRIKASTYKTHVARLLARTGHRSLADVVIELLLEE